MLLWRAAAAAAEIQFERATDDDVAPFKLPTEDAYRCKKDCNRSPPSPIDHDDYFKKGPFKMENERPVILTRTRNYKCKWRWHIDDVIQF